MSSHKRVKKNLWISIFMICFLLLCLHILNQRHARCFKITQNVALEFYNFGIFYELLSTQNVNVARFARNVECDCLADFQTL